MRELIQRNRLIVERRRLQNDSRRADEAGDDKDPQEEAIQHHSYEFPVFNHFDLSVGVFCVLGDELDAPQRAAHIRRQEIVVSVSQRAEIYVVYITEGKKNNEKEIELNEYIYV